MPKAKRGQYDELECLKWYVRYLQAKLQSGGAEGQSVLSGTERAANAKAALLEHELAAIQKKTLSVDDYEKAMADLITPARLELLAIEPRLRPIIGPDAAAKAGAEIRRSLTRLGQEAE
jgi:folylpolyglutamate synthase/dihydropteroate synthase